MGRFADFGSYEVAASPRLLSVMEDHADSVAVSGSQPAHAMPQVRAVGAARALHGAVRDREDHGIALSQGSRAHA